MHFFIHGQYVTEAEAKISVLDLGLIRGYGVFDYLRTYGGRPFHLQEHLERLFYSAKTVGIPIPYSRKEIETIVEELLHRGGYPESSLKIIVTGGVSPDQLLPKGNSSFIAFVYPHKPYPQELHTQGIRTITIQHPRVYPCCKTLQYLPAIVALKDTASSGALESLYLNPNQEILEAATSNFFACKEGVLITPPMDGILAGITREVILKICSSHIPIEIRPIPYAEIPTLEEAFLTASNKEVMPVVQIDDLPIANGKPGKITEKIQKLFLEYTKNAAWEDLPISRHLS